MTTAVADAHAAEDHDDDPVDDSLRDPELDCEPLAEWEGE